jgi:hypothetical protein
MIPTMRLIFVAALLSALLLGTACDAGKGSDSSSDNDGTDTKMDTNVVNEPDGGCTASSCTEDVAPPGDKAFDFVVVQNFSTGDGAVDLSMAWHIGEGDTIGETLPYEMMRFGVCDDRDGVCISSEDKMTYEWKHHNWDETITARAGGREYVVRMSFVPSEVSSWTDTLEVIDLGDTGDTRGPMPLEDRGCRSVPPNNANACMLRDRLD